MVTREWNPEIRTHLDTKISLGKEVRILKFPTHEVHYLPFKPGILDRAYLNFGENFLRPFFLLVKLLDVFLVRFTLRFTSFRNFVPYLETLVKEQQPEKLIVSGEPFYLFRLGYYLKKKFNLSWLADYRDDWSTNQLQLEKSGGAVRRWIARVESNYEKRWVSTAKKIISVSEIYTKRVSNFLKRPGITIQNGFEEELLKGSFYELNPNFTLIYSGVIYPSQDIRMILEVLEISLKNGYPFRLVFLGAAFDIKEKKRIESLIPSQVKSFVELTDRYPRQEALEILRKGHAFLGIAYGSMKGIPSSKLYEYLALGKPVLLCPTDNDIMEQMLKESGMGFFCKSAAEGAEKIREIMQLYKHPEYIAEMKIKAKDAVMPYSRFNQLKLLAQELGN